MTSIIAYTFEADNHCVDCTSKRFQYMDFYLNPPAEGCDANGLHEYQVDSEGNLVHPVFSTDEWQEFDEGFIADNPTQYLTCGDCHEVIEEYTHESEATA